MPPTTKEPQIKSLTLEHRKRLFLLLSLVFILALPFFIFYTTGYRLNFDTDDTSIVSTGGVYVTTNNLGVDVFLDDEQVDQPRLFRSAYYIQNIAAGQHRVVVQNQGLHTWVKELPVYPYIVTEVAAFNMPEVPHLRPITEYVTATGTPVYSSDDTDDVWQSATSTVLFIQADTTKLDKTYQLNTEYQQLTEMFASSTITTQSVFDRVLEEVDRFGFATSSAASDETVPVYVEYGNMRLVEREGELYARWYGSMENIPYYFCLADYDRELMALNYGEHVAVQLQTLASSTSSPLVKDETGHICRPEIKLDRLRQNVYFYDFYPGNQDLVLLQLDDGLYVTEIDDRSWQNTQRIYSGTNFETVVNGGRIYVKDNSLYFEVITEITAQ